MKVQILSALLEVGEPFVVASVLNTKTSSDLRTGECFGMDRNSRFYGTASTELKGFLVKNMSKSMRLAESFTVNYQQSRESASSAGATCGQRSSILFQYVGPEANVFVFGAGDLAIATAKILAIAGFRVTVIDDNEGFLDSVGEHCATRKIDFVDDESYPDICERDYCLVMTRGHLQDANVLRVVLKSKARYIGMIGSMKKNEELKDSLSKMGADSSQWTRVSTPIGLDIGASTPGEIAVAIAAEVVDVKNSGLDLEGT